MPYLIDRQRTLYTGDVVAVLKARQRRIRSRVIMRDNSLYQTLTRPQTLVRRAKGSSRESDSPLRERSRGSGTVPFGDSPLQRKVLWQKEA